MPDATTVDVSAGLSLGAQIDALFDLRTKKTALETEAEAIGEVMQQKQALLLAELEKQGLDRATGKKARVGIAESVVAQVTDWEAFCAYIRRNNAFELIQRRVSDPAYREHAGRRRDKTVPGTVPYVKRKLSLTVNS